MSEIRHSRHGDRRLLESYRGALKGRRLRVVQGHFTHPYDVLGRCVLEGLDVTAEAPRLLAQREDGLARGAPGPAGVEGERHGGSARVLRRKGCRETERHSDAERAEAAQCRGTHGFHSTDRAATAVGPDCDAGRQFATGPGPTDSGYRGAPALEVAMGDEFQSVLEAQRG